MITPALIRAAHVLLDDQPHILEDTVSVSLLPLDNGATIFPSPESIIQRREEFNTAHAKLFRSSVVVRNRFTEDCLQLAVMSGIRQFVLLGAGLDTFALRQPPWARSLTIFEVDHPASQAFKLQRLAQNAIGVPGNLRFCPCDFEAASIGESLTAGGFDPRAKTFFSWLGVTQYLTKAAIETTLALVIASPPGSEIAIAVILPLDRVPQTDLELAASIAAGAARVGEPYLTLLDVGEWRAWLARLGFSSVFHLTAQDTTDRYFRSRRDGLRAPHYAQMILARV